MNRSTVTDINRHVAATLKCCGPAILAPAETSNHATPLEQITASLLLLVQKKHPCQKDADDLDDGEAIEEESAEYDWLVVETALEVVAALSVVLGEQFAQIWKLFETPMLKYASSQERFERSTAVGTIAECIQSMGSACTPFTQRIMRVLLKRMSDEDLDTKSNTAFAMGLLCEKSDDAKEILSNYRSILTKLEPMLDSSTASSAPTSQDSQARLLDNAAGCLGRMIKKSPQHVPLEDVLPRLVEILPLKEDYAENIPVFDMIVGLYQSHNSVIQGLTGNLMPALQKVLEPPEEQLNDEVRAKVQQLVEYLRQ
jgi:importin-4